jgi:ABC-type polysaccharide/polyol phosphate transport system ATPase subunit
MSLAIRAENVSKLYRRMAPGFRLQTLKSALLQGSLTAGLSSEDTIPALEDVSFDVEKGCAFGVIGSNGSGKSTLLKILTGMLKPTRGRVEVEGRVAALIELGAGFHPEISGRENIFINGAVLGLSRREVEQRYAEIVEFSGLEAFIEEPVKNYSSGMYVRLGFAVAVHTDPDILLVDEVLAVGDEAFQHKCLRRIEEFLARGKTLVLVTHSLDLVEKFADEVLWIEGGRKRLQGSPRRVADAYRQAVAEQEGRGHREAKEERQQVTGSTSSVTSSASTREVRDAGEEAGLTDEPEVAEEEVLRWGTREAEIVAARILDGDGVERYHLESGETVVFEITAKSNKPLTDFVFGVGIFTPREVECWGVNTTLVGYESERFDGETSVRLVCPSLRLAPGEYLIDVAVHARDGYPYDYHRKYLSFTMTSNVGGVGIYFPEFRWEFDESIRWKSE